MNTTTTDPTQRAAYLMGEDIECEWTPAQRAAWSGFLELSASLKRDHNRELEAKHDLSISMLGLLGRLAAAEQRTLRLTDLAAAMGLSLSRVSRIIDVLEHRALVGRLRCPTDARAVHAHLTDRGLAQARQAQATLRAAVGRDFLTGLDHGETAVLAAALQRLWQRMEAAADGDTLVKA